MIRNPKSNVDNLYQITVESAMYCGVDISPNELYRSKSAITVIISLQFMMLLMIDVVYSTEYRRIFVCNIATLA